MQRRAVAVYVALFLILASVAGVLVATAESPQIAFENPDHELSEGESFSVDGDEYTLTTITVDEDDEAGEVVTGEIERERTAEQSETWANETVIEVDEREWSVRIDGEDSFTLVEEQDFEALLAEDPNADNETVERDGEEFVVVTDEDGETRLVSPDEYFPAPEERSYAVGDELTYNDVDVTVESITDDAVTVVWMGPETLTIGVEQESTVTIGDTEFIAHFPSDPNDPTLTLSTDFDGYNAQLAQAERLDQYGDGLWRVLIISVLSAMALVGMAFMPSRY